MASSTEASGCGRLLVASIARSLGALCQELPMYPAQRTILSFVALAFALAPLARAQDGPRDDAAASTHPYFDDRGTLRWSTKLEDAQRAALAADKVIFIDYGRRGCVNCKVLCVDILPHASVRTRLGALAVGLAADCDKPESDIEKLFKEHLPTATILPFVGFVTPELEWVGGWSGSTTVEALSKLIEEVETHPLLQAAPPVVKQLEALVSASQKALDKEEWKAVLKAARDGARLRGRSPLKGELDAAAARAHAWAEAQLGAVLDALAAGGDTAEAKKALAAIAARMGSSEREADDVKLALKAVERLTAIRAIEASSTPEKAVGLRVKAALELKGTRWAVLFQPQ